jgi:hypothetical protein
MRSEYLSDGTRVYIVRSDEAQEMLDETRHVEWSLLQKLMKIDCERDVHTHSWPSLDVKLETLCRRASNGRIIGVSAHECLTVGGKKNLIWVDIDSPNSIAVEAWLRKQRIFPSNSYVHINSTTLNSHLYVVTDKPVRESQEKRIQKLIRSSMPDHLAEKLDRVYGPESRRPVFLPMLSLTRATLPQVLVRSLSGKMVTAI